MKKYFLIADIGGTNIRFSILEIFENFNFNFFLFFKNLNKITKITNNKNNQKFNYNFLFYKEFKTNNFKSLEEVINIYLDFVFEKNFKKKKKIDLDIKNLKGFFALAGPVLEQEKINLTNSNLKIFKKEILKKTILEDVFFMGDFQALSFGVLDLKKKDLINVNQINLKKNLRENLYRRCVIGSGTGFGSSFIFKNRFDKNYQIINQEFGHQDLSICFEEEYFLEKFLQKTFKRKNIELEDILSGRGLESIYLFLTQKKLSAQKISLLNQKKDKFAKKTFDIFFTFYARAIKNYTISTMSFGGVFIGGGIILKNLNFNKKKFLKEFYDNLKFYDLLKKTPIYIIKNNKTTLIGLKEYILINFLK